MCGVGGVGGVGGMFDVCGVCDVSAYHLYWGLNEGLCWGLYRGTFKQQHLVICK